MSNRFEQMDYPAENAPSVDDFKDFMLVLRRALKMIVAYIERRYKLTD